MTSAEIKKAMINFSPILYDGRIYKRIKSYAYTVDINPHTNKYKEFWQVVLVDRYANSVSVAPADKIQVYEEGVKE